MAEQQLQMGEMERLDGMGNPQAERPQLPTPSEALQDDQAESDLYGESLKSDLPEIGMEQLSEEEMYAPLTGPLPVDQPTQDMEGPTTGHLMGAADILRVSTKDQTINEQTVLQMLRSQTTPEDVRAMLNSVAGENQQVRREAVLQALTRTDLRVDAKLTLIQELDDFQRWDANAVDRGFIRDAQKLDQQDDSGLSDQRQWEQVASDAVNRGAADVEGVQVATQGAYTKDALTELREAYTKANSDVGILDFAEQMLPVGSLPTFNRAVSNIYKDLNLGDGPSQLMSYGAVGESLADLRNTIHQMNPEQRNNAIGVVLKNLKQHSGLFQDSNDLVTVHVLENLFTKELTGQEYRGGAEFEKTAEERAGLQKQIDTIQQQIDAKRASGDVGQIGLLYTQQDKLRDSLAQLPGPERIADNIFNLLDWVGLGGVAKSTIKFGPRFGGRMWSKLFRQAPEAGAKVALEAAEDGLKAAKMGLTQGQVIELGLPKSGGKAVADQQGTNLFDAWMAQQADNTDVKLRIAAPINLTQRESEKAFQEIAGDFDILLEKSKPKLHLNQSDMFLSEDGNSAELTAVFGQTAQRGWAQLGNARKAAVDAAEDVFGKDARVEIVQYNKATGLLEEVPPGTPDNQLGEYYQRVRDTRSLESAGNTYGAMEFADDTVDKLALGEAVSSWTRGANIFNDFTLDKISVRATQHKALSASFLSDFQGIAKLPYTKQQKLSKVIRESEGRVLDSRQLDQVFDGKKDLIKAYNDFRRIDDVMYELEDRAVRTAYQREGLQDIRHKGQRLGWGTPVTDSSTVVGKNVLDPNTGEMFRMTRQRFEFETRLNGSFAKLKYDVHGQGDSASYVLLKDGQGKLLPIPQSGIMPRIAGHYPHIFQYNHLVRARMTDGSVRAVAGALDKTTAMRHLDRLNARKKPASVANYFVDTDAALREADAYGSSIDELSINRGGILFGKRNEGKIRNLSQKDHVAEYDPVAALLRGTEIMSTKMTKGDLTQSMRVRLGNFLQSKEAAEVLPPGSRTKGPMQLTLSDFPNAPPGSAGDKAKAYMRQIDLMERSPDAWTSLQKGFYRQMSHFAYSLGEKMGTKALSGVDRWASNMARNGGSVVGMGMGLIHKMYISMAAPKQFLYQMFQTTVPLSMHPIEFAKASRQVLPLTGLVMMRLSAVHGGKLTPKLLSMEAETMTAVAKAMGMKPQEVGDLTELVVRSGIIDAVSHNVFIRDAVGEAAQRAAERNSRGPGSALGRLVEQGREALGPLAPLTRGRTYDQAVFGTLSKLGFEGGENLNQLMTLLTLYNADKSAGKAALKSSAYADDLIGRVRELSGNMIKEATPGYARSVIKPILQWVPFQHKMLLLMMPKAFGGAGRFSAADKAKIALGQFFLFGTAGVAITDIAKKGIEQDVVEKLENDPNASEVSKQFVQFWRDPVTRQVMDGYLMDYMGNKTLQALYGEDDPERPGDFAWGRAFAPGSGYGFAADKFQALWSLDKDELFGVTGDYFSRVGQFGQLIRQVATANAKGMDAVPFPERAQMVLNQGAIDLIPMYGKYVGLRWSMENDHYISQGGMLGDGFNSELESKLSFAYGVETKDRQSFMDARDRLADKMSDPQERDAEIRSVADIYWRRLVNSSVKAEAEAPTDEIYHQLMQQHLLNDGLVLSTLDPLDRELFNDIISRKLDTVYKGNGDSAEKSFIEKQSKILESGGYGADGPAITAYLQNLPFVQKNPQYSTMVEQAWMRIMQDEQAQGLRPTDEETE